MLHKKYPSFVKREPYSQVQSRLFYSTPYTLTGSHHGENIAAWIQADQQSIKNIKEVLREVQTQTLSVSKSSGQIPIIN